ncbi:MAG: hypothetical protein AAF694_02490 [Bacteroidota bacterium]
MTSFRSINYPQSKNRWLIFQESAMQFYGAGMLLVMLGVMLKVYLGQNVLGFALIGTVLSLLLGNLLAYSQLKRQVAEVFFLDKHFAVLSVYEILFGHENHVFPLHYASPSRDGTTLSIHYLDRIVQLQKKDWEDFELIWDWFSS